jgi:hypothetical protein
MVLHQDIFAQIPPFEQSSYVVLHGYAGDLVCEPLTVTVDPDEVVVEVVRHRDNQQR